MQVVTRTKPKKHSHCDVMKLDEEENPFSLQFQSCSLLPEQYSNQNSFECISNRIQLHERRPIMVKIYERSDRQSRLSILRYATWSRPLQPKSIQWLPRDTSDRFCHKYAWEQNVNRSDPICPPCSSAAPRNRSTIGLIELKRINRTVLITNADDSSTGGKHVAIVNIFTNWTNR